MLLAGLFAISTAVLMKLVISLREEMARKEVLIADQQEKLEKQGQIQNVHLPIQEVRTEAIKPLTKMGNQLKIGDRIRYTHCDGWIGTVVEPYNKRGDVKVHYDGGFHGGWSSPKDLELIDTDQTYEEQIDRDLGIK